MVRKKTGKWFEDEHVQWITVKGENILEKIHIGKKKRKGQSCHTNWKKSKDTQLVVQKKKPPLGLLSYNAKSAQY